MRKFAQGVILFLCLVFCFSIAMAEKNVKVTSITVNPGTVTLLVGNDQAHAAIKIEATVLPEDATNKKIVWSSSNEKVATVDKNGVVTAHEAGNANIVAESVDEGGRVKRTAKVFVKQAVTAITFTEEFFPFKNFPTPVNVPPVPTPATK